MIPESPSGGTGVIIGRRLKDRTFEEISGPGAYKEKSHIFNDYKSYHISIILNNNHLEETYEVEKEVIDI